jgi:DNA polymerase-3 subunit gamma/tau
MASQALYRRYRSQTFSELIGQEHIVQTLRNALAEGRIAHAYLFTGPRGVGKTTVARLLAKAVNCTSTQELHPCGVCESCVAIADGRAVDMIEMDAASHTSVDDAREIIERVQFRPTSGTYKVYVIDECFRYNELVTLADGSKHPIGKIVEEQWQTEVLSYNETTQQIEPKPIARHMRKQPSLPMVRVTLNNNRAIVCTLNHKFYTPQGLLRAGELAPGQFVYANFERMTRHQFEVVAGAALGDGNLGLTDSKMAYRGQFCPPLDDMIVNGLAVSKVKKVERVPPTEYVYNIEVADNHNYFVRDILVSNCHMLSTAAFNALLKTLEEPPPHALFILATTEVHKVPATILSRCQRFTFNRHTVAAMAAHLHTIAAAEQVVLEPGVAEAIARSATGSMRDALSVLDQLMAYGSGTITLAQVRGLLGATEAQEVAALVDALIAGDVAGALRTLNAVAAQGADLRQFTRDLVERLRALMLLKAGGDPALLDVTEDDLGSLERQSAAVDLGSVLDWVKLFSELDYKLRTSAYGQLPLELAIVGAIAARAESRRMEGPAPAAPTIQGAAAQPPRPAPRPVAAPAKAPTPRDDPPQAPPSAQDAGQQLAPAEPPIEHAAPVEPPPPAQAGELKPAPAPAEPQPMAEPAESESDLSERIASDNVAAAVLDQVESVWDDVLQGIKARDRTLFVLLTSSGGVKPIDLKDDVIVFEVKNDWQVKRIEQPTPRRVIETVLSKYMGANYRISCVAEAQHREHPNMRREQIRNSRKDQHVKAAINIFDADIIDVEPSE